MAYYDFMVEPFAKCIEAGFTKIDEVFPDDLKQKVIAFLASKGLGADGKPLPKEDTGHIGPKGEQGEPGIIPEEETKDEPKDEEKEPKEPVEDEKEDKPSKDTKKEDKSPVEEDKGAK